jgi:hypothetical protein
MKTLKALTLFLCVIILPACGGGSGGTSVNAVNEYSFQATGGTLNDGSGESGLVVLATLRDSKGVGPGLTGGWKITVTGPGISAPLTESYDDGSSSSYQSWWWKGLNPDPGTYTATATNGKTTLISHFDISASNTLVRPALSRANGVVSWNAATGAGSYYYEVTDGYGAIAQSGYLNAGSSSFSFQLNTLPDGSYSISVYAQTKSRVDLMNDTSAMPTLPSQDNISVSTMDLVIANGSTGAYNLSATGGVLYMGQENGVNQYGLVIWTSILTNATPSSPPAADWTISVTGPGIDSSAPIVFTYPKTDSHYVYWDFGTVPAGGTYTVTATTSGSSYTVSAQFTIPAPTAQLPVVTGIGVTPGSSSYAVNWNAVPGAGSYYVSLWAYVGGTYTEVGNIWVDGSTLTAQIPKTSLTIGTLYDVYVTACTLDMTTGKTLPPPSPSQVNMSDNAFILVSFTAQ